MKILKGIAIYTVLIIGAILVLAVGLFGCMFLFDDFTLFGWGVVKQNHVVYKDINSENIASGEITINIDSYLHDVYIYQFSDNTRYISLKQTNDMIGFVKGKNSDYKGSTNIEKVTENDEVVSYDIKLNKIEGSVTPRKSSLVVYVPNGQYNTYNFNIKTTSGDVYINGKKEEIVGVDVNTKSSMTINSLNVETNTGDFSWANMSSSDNVVALKNLNAKTNTGKFNFELGDNITLGDGTSEYYLSCQRGNFNFNNINSRIFKIEGKDVLLYANKIKCDNQFYFNAPSGFFQIKEISANDSGLNTIITNNIDIKLDKVGGELSITTTYGDIEIGTVEHNTILKSTNGNITINKALNSLSASSEHGDITVNEYSNKLRLENKHGKIYAKFTSDGLNNTDGSSKYDYSDMRIQLINEEGSITAEDIVFSSDIKTKNGGTINATYRNMINGTQHSLSINGGNINISMPAGVDFMLKTKGSVSGNVGSYDITASETGTVVGTPGKNIANVVVDATSGNAKFSTNMKDYN